MVKGRKILAVLATLPLMAITFTGGLAAERFTFATSFRMNAHYVLPVLAAKENGLWAGQGLEVRWLPFDSATTMTQAVAAGDVDMGDLALDSIITSVAKDVPLMAVADPGIETIFFLWLKADSPYRRPEEMKGAKIGVTRFGSWSHFYALAAIRALGLDKDVKFISMGGGPAQIAALKAGTIDATNLSFFSMAILKGKGEVRELTRVNDYLPKGYEVADMIYAVRPLLARNPELIKKGVKGFMEGAEFVLNNRDWALAKLKGDFRYPAEAASAAYQMVKYNTKKKIEETTIRAAIKFLVENSLLAREKVPPLTKIYTEKVYP